MHAEPSTAVAERVDLIIVDVSAAACIALTGERVGEKVSHLCDQFPSHVALKTWRLSFQDLGQDTGEG
jgi:hypothetical protein